MSVASDESTRVGVEDGSQGIGNFRSSEWADPDTRLTLLIDYPPVPEAGGAGPPACGGLFLLRRR